MESPFHRRRLPFFHRPRRGCCARCLRRRITLQPATVREVL
ncbi:hypothetical protein MUK42_12990 [Musa troglodytarum]|uniref:Uncharacterized protein n=1 Tax=Musa troglodytarum TaxID=320322 RepID=A0A9E7I292_9LILI|nr:hypothetical protein MUK42_12990 [Musa troglodytarum]